VSADCVPPAPPAAIGRAGEKRGSVRSRPSRSHLRSAALSVVTLVLGVLLAGCVSEYPQSIFDPKSEFAADLAWLFQIILWPAVVVFVLVEGGLVYALFRYRQRPDQPRPEQVHGNTRLEIAWTIAPAFVLAFIAVPTVQTIFVTQAPVAEGALHVNVTGHQFWWEYEYPDLGISGANELWVPVGQTIGLTQTSVDVIHSYWVPAMGGKRDVIPNQVTHIWWTPNTAGTYLGQCGEYCGDSHANMRLRVHAVSPAEFEQWVQQQKTAVGAPAAGAPESVTRGATLIAPCVGCHTIDGNPLNANQRVGPNLSHLAGRQTFAAGIFPLDKEHLARWIRNSPREKPGSLMPAFPNINQDDAEAIADYLLTLK
jgi:cytochrome c oxidase subunit II